MSALNFNTLSKYAQIGQSMSVTLANFSEEISGRILEINQDSIVLDTTEGTEIILLSQIVKFKIKKNDYSEIGDIKFVNVDDGESKKNSDKVISQDLIDKTEYTIEEKIKEEQTTDKNNRDIEEEKFEEKQTINIDDINLIFTGEPIVSLPYPDFDTNIYPEQLKSEIIKWKNKYEYAEKVHEPARMIHEVSYIEELAESYASKTLYYLAGLLSIYSETNLVKAKNLFQKALEIDVYFRNASICIAYIFIQEKKYDDAIKFILWSIFIDQHTENSDLLKCLGQCALKIEREKISTIGIVLYWKLKDNDQRLARTLIALIVRDDVAASNYALKGDIVNLRTTKIGNDIFPWDNNDGSMTAPIIVRKIEKKTIKNNYKGSISAYFPERRFGFIVEESTGQTWFFHESSLDDQLLNRVIDEKIVQDVFFTKSNRPSTGKYPIAENISMQFDKDYSLSSYSLRAPLGKRLVAIPKDRSSFAQAMEAEQRDDLDKAEILYINEITSGGKHKKSAVKNLASLQNRRGNPILAIETLNNNKKLFDNSEQISLKNMQVQFYIKARQYDDALVILRNLANQAQNYKKRSEYQRQEAYCLLALGNFDEALLKLTNLLKSNPNDLATSMLITKAESAKETGSFFIEEESFASIGSGISIIAQYKLDECKLSGIDQRTIDSGNFTSKDIEQVQNLLTKFKGRRPNERAEYLLTLAWLCNNEQNLSGRLYEYLRRYFVAMAESAYAEISVRNNCKDVVRCYALESLILCPKDFGKGDETRNSFETAWVLLLGTYLSEPIEASRLLQPGSGKRLPNIINLLNSQYNFSDLFQLDVNFYSSRANTAFQHLQSWFPNHKISNIKSDNANEKERSKRLDNIFANLPIENIIIQKIRSTVEMLDQLNGIHFFDLDQSRLYEFSKILGDIVDYSIEMSFREKEPRYLRLDNDISNFINDIKRYPTHISIEYLSPSLASLKKIIYQDFLHYESLTPNLELKNVLDNDFYVVNNNSVSLKLLIISKDKFSPPIEGISLIVENDEHTPCHTPEPLHGGESREVELTVYPSQEQINDGVFSINIKVIYRNRKGTNVNSPIFPIAIRLSESNFSKIPNPYMQYAGGNPVEDREMFFGRSELIENIIQCLTNNLGQCFVLYGQKRSGKSSVLRQIENKLDDTFLYIRISAGDFVTTSNLWQNFASRFIQELSFCLEDKNIKLPEIWPNTADIEIKPMESIRASIRIVGKINLRVILAIDEFTYIYEYGEREADIFMKSWKSLIESKTFNALIVGQDTMPRFKQAFPNEFGITYDERISYLNYNETTELVTQPILLNGQSRYRGQAVRRLFDFTAGSPFYLQIFCDKLVQYLNEQRASFITEADIENVSKILTRGEQSLPPEKFDALITAAGQRTEIIPRDFLLKILKRVAHESLHSGICYKASLNELEFAEEALKDLVDREILLSQGDRVSIRVGLFAAWLREN